MNDQHEHFFFFFELTPFKYVIYCLDITEYCSSEIIISTAAAKNSSIFNPVFAET
jgi:hypothetical protein